MRGHYTNSCVMIFMWEKEERGREKEREGSLYSKSHVSLLHSVLHSLMYFQRRSIYTHLFFIQESSGHMIKLTWKAIESNQTMNRETKKETTAYYIDFSFHASHQTWMWCWEDEWIATNVYFIPLHLLFLLASSFSLFFSVKSQKSRYKVLILTRVSHFPSKDKTCVSLIVLLSSMKMLFHRVHSFDLILNFYSKPYFKLEIKQQSRRKINRRKSWKS